MVLHPFRYRDGHTYINLRINYLLFCIHGTGNFVKKFEELQCFSGFHVLIHRVPEKFFRKRCESVPALYIDPALLPLALSCSSEFLYMS